MVLDNSPALGWIRITNAVVTYRNKLYVIPDDSTEKKYIYWDSNNPATYEKTNVIHPETDTKFLVLINDNGMHTIVHSKTDFFNIAFDSGIQAKVDSKIIGLYEETKDEKDRNVAKFSTIIQKIDGINQTVGEIKKDSISKYTELNQKVDSFELSVKDTTSDLGHVMLRDKVIKEYLATAELLGQYEIALQGIMRDEKLDFNGTKDYAKVVIGEGSDENVVGVSEKEQIRIYNEALKKQIDKLNSVLMEVYNDKKLREAKKGELDIIKDNIIPDLNRKYNFLVELIDSACLDKVFASTEITAIYSALQDILGTLSRNKSTVDRIISLGYGGKIVDTVGKFFLNKDKGGFDFIKKINDTEKEIANFHFGLNNLSAKLGKYDDKLEFHGTQIQATNKLLSTKVSSGEFTTQINQLSSSIKSKASKGDIKSTIEQSPDSIKIGFQNIKNSAGKPVATFDQYGLVITNGSVATDTLTVPEGHSPVIRLFDDRNTDNGTVNFSEAKPEIDASYNHGTGYGEYIRLKWSSSDYIRVGRTCKDLTNQSGSKSTFEISEFNAYLHGDPAFTVIELAPGQYDYESKIMNTGVTNSGRAYEVRIGGRALATVDYVNTK